MTKSDALSPPASDAQLQELEAKMRNYALSLLVKRDYPTTELKAKLRAKFADAPQNPLARLTDQTITWLQELGYLDDLRYCRMFIEAGASKGHGRMRIRQDLRQKKRLPQPLIESMFDEVELDWFKLAEEALRRKFRAPPIDAKDKARMIRFLQYRGFSGDEVFGALDRAWAESDD